MQGASYADLRVESAKTITQMPFDGYAIGGLAVGESRRSAKTAPPSSPSCCRRSSPRYLMGVGTTRDLLEAVHRGVDMFDCILPTSLAKQGVAFTSLGRRDLRRAAYRGMEGPIDPACGCYTCRTYSIAYLFHLQRVHETTGWQLLGLHNIHFYMQLMRTMREHILAGTWLPFYHAQRDVLDARDSYGKARESCHQGAATRAPAQTRPLRSDREGGYRLHPRHGLRRSHALGQRSCGRGAFLVRRAVAADRASAGTRTDQPLVVWDVGLGAAANAMTAIRESRQCGARDHAAARSW